MTVSLDRINPRLEDTLADLASTIEIQADFTITHPQHEPIELPREIQERFRQMPESVQDQYLQVKIQTLIHELYHHSAAIGEASAQSESLKAIPQLPASIENQAIKWSKSEFYQQLRINNHCDGHFESGWLITGTTAEGFLQVRKNDLTLHIRSDRHVLPQEQNAQIGDTIAVKMPPQLVEPGFYTAVGSKGSINDLPSNCTIVDVYCHLNSEGALALMDRLTIELNQITIPFHFKVIYYPDNYQWCDAAVLSFSKDDYPQVKPILANIYSQTQSYFQSTIPLFTKYLADGVGLAERPFSHDDAVKTRSQYCLQLVAQGLLDAWKANQPTPAMKLQQIRDRFTDAGIKLAQPYLNPDSPDIYDHGIVRF